MHDRMKTALRINVGWGVVLLAEFAYLALGRYSHTRGVMVALSVAYAIIAILALRLQRWAVAVSVGVAILLMIRWLPMVVVNFWMFAAGHKLYQDSPATIFIVVVYAVVFAAPATLLSTLYVFKRKELWRLIGYRM